MPKPVKRIVIAAGGTGGHLFPAQSLAKSLLLSKKTEALLFMGGGLSNNLFFEQKQFPFQDIPAATFSLRKPLQILQRGGKITKGIIKSRSCLKAFAPDLVVGFGSYYALPVLTAAFLQKIPIILHEQNAIPGKVNRLFSRYAKCTAITFPEANTLLKGRSEMIAFPLRFSTSECTKEDALEKLSLNPNYLTFVIMGGSQGAKSINNLALKTLPTLCGQLPSFQVIHLAGKDADLHQIKQTWKKAHIPAYVKSFEKRMDLVWAASDCAITRAGASSLAEQIACATPGIVIPYPHAMDNHQEKNGKSFETLIGGILFDEKKEDAQAFRDKVYHVATHLEHYKRNLQKHHSQTTLPTLVELIYEE